MKKWDGKNIWKATMTGSAGWALRTVTLRSGLVISSHSIGCKAIEERALGPKASSRMPCLG